MEEHRQFLTFELLGLCLVSGIAYCNITVFYNLFGYLQISGIPAELCGVIIGSYSLTAVVFYLLASPYINTTNAPRVLWLGMIILAVCGWSYLFIHSFWGLLGLRMFNGLGQFFMAAAGMALFVSVVPPERSGQAFGVYSIAGLIPYGAVPAIMDALSAYIPTPPHGYAAATILLVPAAWIVRKVQLQRHGERIAPPPHLPSWGVVRVNVIKMPILLLLILCISNFISWSSLFYLFQKFALQMKVANVGSFFTVQMGLMLTLRLFLGKIFDSVDKRRLVRASAALVAVGYLVLDNLPGAWAMPLAALPFGLGMGIGMPALYGLMFEASPPQYRPLTANLMLCAVQIGFVLGPILGGALVAHFEYHGFFLGSAALAMLSSILSCFLWTGQRAFYS